MKSCRPPPKPFRLFFVLLLGLSGAGCFPDPDDDQAMVEYSIEKSTGIEGIHNQSKYCVKVFEKHLAFLPDFISPGVREEYEDYLRSAKRMENNSREYFYGSVLNENSIDQLLEEVVSMEGQKQYVDCIYLVEAY